MKKVITLIVKGTKMRKFRKISKNKSYMKRHRHVFKVGRMKGLTSIPVRFRGRRI